MKNKVINPIVANILWNGDIRSVYDDEYIELQKSIYYNINDIEDEIFYFNKKFNIVKIKNHSEINKRYLHDTLMIYRINNKFDLIISIVKNSGIKNNDRKRIKTKPNEFKNISTYCIGILYVGNKFIYILTDDMYEKLCSQKTKNGKKSSRSEWLDFDYIKNIDRDIYQKKIITDKNNITYSKDLNLLLEVLFSKFYLDKEENKNSYSSYIKLIEDLDEIEYLLPEEIDSFNKTDHINEVNSSKLKRNINLVKKYREEHKYCENCGIKNTFISKESKKNYFEVHHFLPYNIYVQNEFKYSLDSYINLVSLCPTCHRAIHLSVFEFQKEIIKKIYNLKISEEFKIHYGDLKLEKVFDFYENTYNINSYVDEDD